jgi:hypothetical protein
MLLALPAFAQQTLGSFAEDDTIHFLWTTVDSAGEPVTRSTDGTVSVYKDNGTTQSTAGVTDTEDFDSLTGVHAVTIDLSADAFYATGSNYVVTINGAVVDTVTVNAPIAYFTIENEYERGTDSAALASGVNVTQIEGSDATDTLGTAQTGDSYAEIGTAGAGLSDIPDMATDTGAGVLLSEIQGTRVDTEDLQTQIGTAGAGLTALGDTRIANLDATVSSRSTGAALSTAQSDITSILEDTGTTIPALIAALDDIDATEVQTAVNAALEALHLDHLLAVTYDPASKPGAADALLNELVESDAGVARFTANALEQGPAGSAGFDPETDTVDGVTYETAIKMMMSQLIGKITVSGDDYTYYARDNTTVLFTLTDGTTERTRAEP